MNTTNKDEAGTAPGASPRLQIWAAVSPLRSTSLHSSSRNATASCPTRTWVQCQEGSGKHRWKGQQPCELWQSTAQWMAARGKRPWGTARQTLQAFYTQRQATETSRRTKPSVCMGVGVCMGACIACIYMCARRRVCKPRTASGSGRRARVATAPAVSPRYRAAVTAAP
jgi:hypothetical protein